MQQAEQLIIIKDINELDRLKIYLSQHEYVAFDTETTGLDKDAIIIGYSVAAEIDKGYYVVLAEWDKEANTLKFCDQVFKTKALEILQNLNKNKLVMHNAVFDVQKVQDNFGINLLNALHTDTMILAHLLNENEKVGLKDLGARIFGEDSKVEQEQMLASIVANTGTSIKGKKNLPFYKASTETMGKYAAKDAILTLKLFYHFVPILFEENLDSFFYDEECMPLLKTATYELNTTGIKIDVTLMRQLKEDLEKEINMLRTDIITEIYPSVKEKYPGTNAKNSFNIESNQQLAWLLFVINKETFETLTDAGKEKAKELLGKTPYSLKDKLAFISEAKKAGFTPEKFFKCDVSTLEKFKDKYVWIKKLLQLKKATKLLSTYVDGILEKIHYGILYPSFLQTGTTGTRYSSRAPNCQNLPRDDKRIKSCMIARDGYLFVGADQSQLEPRVFTAVSQDAKLLQVFNDARMDFYSQVSIETFGLQGEYSANSEDQNFLKNTNKNLRQLGKVIGLSLAYGTTAFKLAHATKLPVDECEEIRVKYFKNFTGVDKMVKDAHDEARKTGKVFNLFGRPRRIPEAKRYGSYKNFSTDRLSYEARNLFNLAVNYKIQGTAGSIMNRICIKLHEMLKEQNLDARIILQVHDELVLEAKAEHADKVAELLKYCMENTVRLDGVPLIAEPTVGKRLSDLK